MSKARSSSITQATKPTPERKGSVSAAPEKPTPSRQTSSLDKTAVTRQPSALEKPALGRQSSSLDKPAALKTSNSTLDKPGNRQSRNSVDLGKGDGAKAVATAKAAASSATKPRSASATKADPVVAAVTQPAVNRRQSATAVAPIQRKPSATANAPQRKSQSTSLDSPKPINRSTSGTISRSNSMKKKRIPNAIGAVPWADLRLRVNDLKSSYDVVNEGGEGLTPHTFKKFCRDLSFETNAITLNSILTDHSASFGEFLTYFVADMMDEAVYGFDFDAATAEFESYDENRDNVIDKFEFQKFTTAANIPADQVAESSGSLSYVDFIEFKITGKLRNEKGLDGLKRKFDEMIQLNKASGRKFHGAGMPRLDSALLPKPMEGSDATNARLLTARDPLVGIKEEPRENILDDDNGDGNEEPL